MASLLLNLVENLAEGVNKIKCKYGYDNRKCETCEIKYKDVVVFINTLLFWIYKR